MALNAALPALTGTLMLAVLVLLLIARTDRFFYPLLAPGRIDRLTY